jgi:hypothetical protein
VDEFAHVPAGYASLTRGDFALYGKTPPLARTLFALPLLPARPILPEPPPGSRMAGWYPWTYAAAFFQSNLNRSGIEYVDGLYGRARSMVIAMAVVLGALLCWWAWRLHGAAGALIALTLFTFDPNILAHSGLATVDLAATLFFFAAVMALTFHLHRPGWLTMAAAGLLLGTALSAKFTGILLLPIFAALSLVAVLRSPAASRWRIAFRAARDLAVMGLLALLVINASYRFAGTFRTFGGYQVRSHLLSRLQVAPLTYLPIPLPADYLRGFDAQQVDLEVGDFPNYLNGRWSRAGWWHYEILTLILKTPIAALLAILAAALLSVARAFEAKSRGREKHPRGVPSSPPDLNVLTAWAVAISVGAILLAAAGSRLDIGLRYILPIHPFLFLGTASLGRVVRRDRPLAALAVGAALLLAVGSTLATYPHYLAYFNPAAGGPAGGWRILANSNNDWGQDLRFLRDEIERRDGRDLRLAYFGHVDPQAYGISYTVPLPGASGADALLPGNGPYPYTFAPGLYAISVNLLVGLPYQVVDHGRWVAAGETLAQPQEIFAWFRRRPPDAIVGGSILIYDLRLPGA